MLLAYLLASNKTQINTVDDLANAQVMATTSMNSYFEMNIRVNIINIINRFNYHLQHDALLSLKGR